MSSNGQNEGRPGVLLADVVRARRVELADDAGTVRAVLSGGTTPESPCGLMLNDAGGTTRLAVHITTHGTPQVDILGADGTPKIHLALDRDGAPLVAILGQGSDGITFRVPAGGAPTMELIDAAGDARVHLRADEQGAGLVMVAIPGRSQLILATRNAAPAVLLTDKEGKPRVSITMTEADGPDIRTLQADGQTPAWASPAAERVPVAASDEPVEGN
jgi:hypothetical protein